MAIEILYDMQSDRAILFSDSGNPHGWAIGPVFHGSREHGTQADEEAQAFLDWFQCGAATIAAGSARVAGIVTGNGRDPRDWQYADLERLHEVWAAARYERGAA